MRCCQSSAECAYSFQDYLRGLPSDTFGFVFSRVVLMHGTDTAGKAIRVSEIVLVII